MDRTSLEMRTLSPWECCVGRNTFNVWDFLLRKVLVLFAPEHLVWLLSHDNCIKGCFFVFFHHSKDLFLNMGPLHVSDCLHKKQKYFFPGSFVQKTSLTTRCLMLHCKRYLFFAKTNQKRVFLTIYTAIFDHCESNKVPFQPRRQDLLTTEMQNHKLITGDID